MPGQSDRVKGQKSGMQGMVTRMRLLQGAAALLYVGPLLAGLGGFGWSVVPVFTAIFLLWLVVIRPQDWPQQAAGWARPEAWLALLARALVQVVLVTVCFGIGRGIGGAAGLSPAMPVGLPLGLSFAAIPLARLVWNPTGAAAMDSFLEDALQQVEGLRPPPLQRDPALAQRLTAPLADLPETVPLTEIEAHFAALKQHLLPEDIYEALDARLQSPDAPRALRRTFILLATAQRCNEACRGRAAPVRALQVAGEDAALVELVARRCQTLLESDVDAWGDCPNPAALGAIAARMPPRTAEAIRALIDVTRKLAPLNGYDPES